MVWRLMSRIALRQRAAAALVFSGFALACSSEDASLGEGQLEVRVSGEEGAQSGFPFSEDGETVGFADDWRVTFSKFLISIGGIRVQGTDGKVAVSDAKRYVADLHQGVATLAVYENLPARRWDSFNFEIVAPDRDSVGIDGVSPADLDRMREGNFNYWAEGSASKGDYELSFAWGFTNPTLNSNCTNGVDGSSGVVVPNNSRASAEITVHLDHLFWTTLGTEGAQLRFEAIAAAGRDDNEISMEDLAEQRLSNLVGMDGSPLLDEDGNRVLYNPESVRLASQDLRAFLLASSSSMGHLNGEGLCTVEAHR